MDIQLGKPVISKDGEDLGSVGRIVLDPETREVVEIVIHQGVFFPSDRIVDTQFIDEVDARGVLFLSIDAVDTAGLPRFFETEYVIPAPQELHDVPYPIEAFVNAGGMTTSPILWRTGYGGNRNHVADQSLFGYSVVESGSIEVRDSLETGLVAITTGTEVIGSDGHRVGTVTELVYDEGGALTSVITSSGFVIRHHALVSNEMIAGITPDHIRLTVPAGAVLDVATREGGRH
jgi:sporulation protein YlmC with PRC-barrel domain